MKWLGFHYWHRKQNNMRKLAHEFQELASLFFLRFLSLSFLWPKASFLSLWFSLFPHLPYPLFFLPSENFVPPLSPPPPSSSWEGGRLSSFILFSFMFVSFIEKLVSFMKDLISCYWRLCFFFLFYFRRSILQTFRFVWYVILDCYFWSDSTAASVDSDRSERNNKGGVPDVYWIRSWQWFFW